MENIDMLAILYKRGDGNYEIWWNDLPKEAQERIACILDEYGHRGCTLCGSLEDVVQDIKGLEKK